LTIDISQNPDLLHLVEEMRRRNTSAVLRNGTADVAVVMPVEDAKPRGGKLPKTADRPSVKL